jgi:hypothetical protein
LQLALTQTSRETATLDQAIKDFLSAQGTAPLARNLRRAWLLDLAARREWTLFLASLPTNTSDAELRCLAAMAQLSNAAGNASDTPTPTQDTTLNTALGSSLTCLWSDTVCLQLNLPFERARSNRIITADLIEQWCADAEGGTEPARELAAMPRRSVDRCCNGSR